MPHPNPTSDPNFYCHGQQCIDRGCSPLRCEDTPMDNDWSDDSQEED